MSDITVYGFAGSCYVRIVRMILAEKGVTDYKHVPVDVLKGEPKQPEHLARHAFGKVPAVDIDGFHLIETPAIARYLDTVLPGKKLVPADPKDVARMDMVISINDSYGYLPMVGGVTAYHLFPDYVGGKNEEFHHKGIADSKLYLQEIMKIRGSSPWFAGSDLSIADLYVAPVMSYVTKTPHKDEFLALPNVKDWWDKVSALPSYASTEP